LPVAEIHGFFFHSSNAPNYLIQLILKSDHPRAMPGAAGSPKTPKNLANGVSMYFTFGMPLTPNE
jgi:hypothetical protein